MLSKKEILYENIIIPGASIMSNINSSEEKTNGKKARNATNKTGSIIKPYFEQIFENTTTAVLILNEKNQILNVNSGFEELFHYSINEIKGKYIIDLIVPENLKEESEDILDKILHGVEIKLETIRRSKDGYLIDVYITGNRLTFEDNKTGSFLIYTDISSHKRSEEQMRASLVEKEVLLKEIHHRVKNNLQVVSSLLYLQSKRIKDRNIELMFIDCQNRVKSISLIHEKLYQTNDLARVDMDKYIKSLVYHLFNSFGVKSDQISLTIKSENIFITTDTAIPCGLIINELVTNSLKHAFPDHRKGSVSIEVIYHRDNKFTLIVKDNGIGIPENVDYQNSDTLGFLLVQNLVRQLDATIEIIRDNGTEYRITFSILNYKGGGE